MQQNINISGGQEINIIQVGRDVYYAKQEKDKDSLPQQTQESQKPSLSALVLMSNPFIKNTSNRPIPIKQLEIDKEKEILGEKLKQQNANEEKNK